MPGEFFATLSRHWWVFALRGAMAVVFGVLAMLWPKPTLIALVFLWGAYALIDGVLALMGAFRTKDAGRSPWMLVLIGIAGILAGIGAFAFPGMTALILLMFIAAWAIVIGVLQIVTAIRLREEIDNEWFLGLSGLVSVLFGVLMIWHPGAGALAVIWVIAAFSIFFGLLLIMLSLRLRKHASSLANPSRATGQGV
jgi:uncharacterized membrane protein HdeD (DUF308 family)